MAKLLPEVKTAIEKTSPVCISTANKEGIPNIVYVTFLKIYNDETIVIADNKFCKTLENLKENPVISFVVLDKDVKKAYQIKGKVEYVTAGEKYDYTFKWVQDKRADLKPKGAAFLSVDEIYCGAEKLA